jgi:ubiquitin-protein ligase
MDARIRRFDKEKHLIPSIQINTSYENMIITPTITLTIPYNYPFKPPILKINNIYYVKYLERGFRLFKPFIDHYKINTAYNCCLCCSSVTGEKWTPCNGIKEIIQEYIKYDTILRTIANAKLVVSNIGMDDLINLAIINYL